MLLWTTSKLMITKGKMIMKVKILTLAVKGTTKELSLATIIGIIVYKS